MRVIRLKRAEFSKLFGQDPLPEQLGYILYSEVGVPLINYIFTDPAPDPIKFLTAKDFEDICKLEKLYELQDLREKFPADASPGDGPG